MIKKLLITGGAGFIGINFARHFRKLGWDITLFDNFSRRGTDKNVETLLSEYKKGITVETGDIRTDVEKMTKLMEKHDAVIHLAAQVAVTTSVTDPRTDFEHNALGTFNVLEALRATKKRPPLLFSSTNKVYGGLEQFPAKALATRYVFKDETLAKYGVSESVNLDFHSPYGCSKGTADQYVIDYGRIYGLQTAVFRQSCIYGRHQFGIEDQGWVAWFSIAAMLGLPITIYGTGKQLRDVLFVDDLCRLYELALDNMSKVNGNAYNIGGGPANTLSVKEILGTFKKRYPDFKTPALAEMRPGDQPVFVADIRKAKKHFGWAPKIGVDEGIELMTEWLHENKETIASFYKKK
jgi:CDP-paratose 2-epimerase